MKKILFFIVFVMASGLSMAQWSLDPAANNLVGGISGDDVIPKVATASDGNTYISWFSQESGNYNVRMQLFDPAGNELWANGGILISDHTSMSWLTDYNLSVDKENCAIVGFQDIRNGNNNIHVYKISPSGQFLWGANGLSLSENTAFEPYPVIQNLADNSTVFAWQSQDTAGQGVIRLQKIGSDSTRHWGQWGIIYNSSNPDENYIYPSLVASDNNSVILIFHKQTGSWNSPKYIYAQKFDANGALVWAQDMAIFSGSGVPIIPSITCESDSANGAVICWHDTRQGMGMFNVYVQRITSTGILLFTPGGQVVTTSGNYIQMNPSMTYVPSTQEVYTFFNLENVDQNQWGLAGQKIDATGQLLWGNAMLTLIPVSSVDIGSIRVRRSAGQVLVTYTLYDFGNFIDAEIKATLLDASGTAVWTPSVSTICSVQSGKGHQVTGYYGAHQWVLAWEDDRSGNADVYAQNILINGELGPYATGTGNGAGADIDPISLYPNPADDVLNLTVNGFNGEETEIGLYNLLGEKVFTLFTGTLASDRQHFQMDISGLHPGCYFIRLSNSISTAKAVIVN
jgi:hypothetical protein